MHNSEHSKSAPFNVEKPLCAACGGIIGVYETVVHVFEGLAWRTSRAAEPGIGAAAGDRYHLACFECLEEKPPLSA